MIRRRRENYLKFNTKRFLFFCLVVLFAACGEERNEASVEAPVTEVEEGTDIGAVEWNYENTDWEEIGDNECNLNVQSPVNITTEDAIPAQLGSIDYEYEQFPMRIVDNGHTVQVFGTESSYITVANKRYQFKQFHFHNPSEHTIDETTFPLEMHLVHQEEGSDNLVVLGVFIEEGQSNQFLEKVFTRIPEVEKREVETDISISLSDYIPPAQTYYTYIGSLTTPPCTVGVDWIVFEEPIQASGEQIQKFADLYANSARPVQPLKNRRVLKSME